MSEYTIMTLNQPPYSILKKFPHFVIQEKIENGEQIYVIGMSKHMMNKFLAWNKDKDNFSEIFKTEIEEIETIIDSVPNVCNMRMY